MKNIISLLALVLICYTSAFSQAFGEIHGKVFDEQGIPIPGVRVIASSGSTMNGGDMTDSTGRFKIKPLEPGVYGLVMSMIGKDTLKYANVQVNADRITHIPAVEMEIASGLMKGVEILEYIEPQIIKDGGGSYVAIRQDQLKMMSVSHGGNIKSIAAALTSEIKTSANGEELYFRGSRSGSVIYMIDGVKIRENVPNIPSSGISRMAVYTGGLPAKYGDTTGGVIVIDTKNYLEDYYRKMNK